MSRSIRATQADMSEYAEELRHIEVPDKLSWEVDASRTRSNADGETAEALERLPPSPPAPPPPTAPQVAERQLAAEPIGSDGFHLTDQGEAERLINRHRNMFRRVKGQPGCLVYNPELGLYESNPTHAGLFPLLIEMNQFKWGEFAKDPDAERRKRSMDWNKKSESLRNMEPAAKLALENESIAVHASDLDSNATLLNAVNGIVDLDSGELLPHDPAELITKSVSCRYSPSATAPVWQECLEQWQPDPGVRRFLQQALGLSLLGVPMEQVAFINLGHGANGKSTFSEVVRHVFGTYATVIADDLLIKQRNPPHATSTANLMSARYAAANELEACDSLAEAKIKSITGGDTINARWLYGRPFMFEPSHTVWIYTNNLPAVSGTDDGIWRRLLVIKWPYSIPRDQQDPKLKDRLAREHPGILRWMVEGCMDYLENGLEPPEAVLKASADYRRDSDWLQRFLDDSGFVVTGSSGDAIPSAKIVTEFESWVSEMGERTRGIQQVAKGLKRLGCTQKRTNKHRLWIGIAQLSDGGDGDA